MNGQTRRRKHRHRSPVAGARVALADIDSARLERTAAIVHAVGPTEPPYLGRENRLNRRVHFSWHLSVSCERGCECLGDAALVSGSSRC